MTLSFNFSIAIKTPTTLIELLSYDYGRCYNCNVDKIIETKTVTKNNVMYNIIYELNKKVNN